ncbi:MAG: mechanosensitive ion channel family protein [Oscillospiraceae bacterium]|nr:mechanosensitive ion channel family protein [Oscillospiraceae bacterium]
MKRILLTAEEAVAASEGSVSAESIDAFLETLKKMEMSEIIAKYGEKTIWALITVVIGVILVRWALRFIMRYVEKSELAAGATKFIHGIVAFLLYFIVLLTAASVIGIPVTSVLAVFSVFTLAFSLAIKDIIALFASGITILFSKPFNAGDFVEIPEEGISGFVSEVGLIHTHLFTADNKEIIIPNSIVAGDTLINYSKIGLRRLDSVYSIDYEDDFEKAKSVIREVVDSEPLVEKEKPIFISVTALAPSGVDIVCKVYVKWDNYETLRCRLNEQVKLAFDKNNIHIPYTQMDIHMK